MHNAGFAELELDAIYLAFDVKPDHLMEVLPAMRRMGFCGVNLTIPLKEVAAKGLKVLDESGAQGILIRAVAAARDRGRTLAE